VGWSDLLRRRQPRTKTTVEGVAAALTEAIVVSTNALQHRLAAEGFAWTDRARADTDECLLECTLFEWFLRDVAAAAGFGKHAEALRRSLAGRVLVDLQRSGVSTTSLDDYDRRCRERFAEYAEAMDRGSSLQALGAAAWRRISGSGEPSERMTMLLAIRARGELLRLGDVARSYTIIELLRSPVPLPDPP
jgi:hypothetical protein